MTELPQVIGVIYPLPELMVNRALKRKRMIFVKFTTHEPTKKTKSRLRNGIKYYFYQSNAGKIIVGEAKILKHEYLQKDEIVNRYRNVLITTKRELGNYTKGREKKRLLVLYLVGIKKYKKPVKLKKQITMAGHYVTEDNKEIFSLN